MVCQKQGMTRFDKNFAAVSQHMASLSAPMGKARGAMPIASLIERVNARCRTRQAALARRATAMPATASSAPAAASGDQR
jgi:hypothetical protein